MIQQRRYPDVDLFPTPAVSEAGWKPLGLVPSFPLGTLFRDLWGRGKKPLISEEQMLCYGRPSQQLVGETCTGSTASQRSFIRHCAGDHCEISREQCLLAAVMDGCLCSSRGSLGLSGQEEVSKDYKEVKPTSSGLCTQGVDAHPNVKAAACYRTCTRQEYLILTEFPKFF